MIPSLDELDEERTKIVEQLRLIDAMRAIYLETPEEKTTQTPPGRFVGVKPRNAFYILLRELKDPTEDDLIRAYDADGGNDGKLRKTANAPGSLRTLLDNGKILKNANGILSRPKKK